MNIPDPQSIAYEGFPHKHAIRKHRNYCSQLKDGMLTMFRSIDFYDHLTSHIVSPWWLYLIMGVNFLLLAVLVLILPQHLFTLVAVFLVVDGVILVAIAFRVRRLRKHYQKWIRDFWHPFE